MPSLDWVFERLAIGPRPTGKHDWQLLKTEGITLVIDLNDDPAEKVQARKLGLRYQGVRVDDPPARAESLVEIFQKIREIVDEETARGGRVYLHCTAGQQRSPTCAMAYLIATGLDKDAAIERVRSARLGVWAGPVGSDLWRKALDIWGKEISRKMSDPNRVSNY